MNDPILECFVDLAKNAPQAEQEITLIVGGFLISGVIITREEYMQQNELTSAIMKALENISAKNPPPSDEPEDDSINYIHLRDAKYFVSGNNLPIPNNSGVSVRISLSSVHGFHLGILNAELGK